MPNRSARPARGFTVIELAAVVALGSVVMTQLAPMARRARNQTRGMTSANNLMQIGQGAGMYGLDNADRIPGYSWAGPEADGAGRVPYDIGDGIIVRVGSDAEAGAAQQAEILRQRTGRGQNSSDVISYEDGRIPHRRFTHLVLMDYLDRPFPDPMFIDPRDANQLGWASNPLDYHTGSTVPYANGVQAGYDSDPGWASLDVRNRWAFGSSYQSTVSAWQPDGRPRDEDVTLYVPVSSTPHLMSLERPDGADRTVELSNGRRFREVQFPAAKVYFYEEFDRSRADAPYFAYNLARCGKLMFDGSINELPSGAASKGWSPSVFYGKSIEWRQTYVPLDTYPLPLGGLGDSRVFYQRFRWTMGGLRGVDYATPIGPSNR